MADDECEWIRIGDAVFAVFNRANFRLPPKPANENDGAAAANGRIALPPRRITIHEGTDAHELSRTRVLECGTGRKDE
jgi:hypothetical protein